MEYIYLKQIKIDNNLVEYVYDVSSGLSPFFSSNPFFVSYQIDRTPMDLNMVPEGVLAVTFVCNILPIIWITDAELILDELDDAFFKSIPNFKKGYIEMYPDLEFKGKIKVKRLTNNKALSSSKSASFFSGGLDAWCTLVRHIDEHPDLILLWGADIPYTEIEGWRLLEKNVKDTADVNNLRLITVRTSFREVIKENELDRVFSSKIHDSWWHGIQHGIALIGHAAPNGYLRGVSKLYIAASFSPEDKNITCASYPSIDNYVKFYNCQVFHDAFITRSKKTEEIVAYRKRTGESVNLHVCWMTIDGENCCRCEKCLRTIMGILLEGDYPEYYGFDKQKVSYKRMFRYIVYDFDFSEEPFLKVFWKKYQHLLKERKKSLKKMPYYNNIKWILKVDFDNMELTRSRFNKMNSIKSMLSKLILYRGLHNVKMKYRMIRRSKR